MLLNKIQIIQNSFLHILTNEYDVFWDHLL